MMVCFLLSLFSGLNKYFKMSVEIFTLYAKCLVGDVSLFQGMTTR